MTSEKIFGKISDLKQKFKNFFQQRKQIAALENYSRVKKFSVAETVVMDTIKFCMKGQFLEEEDNKWIQGKLKRIEINYLDWSHRTRWLKQEIEKRKVDQPAPVSHQPYSFDREFPQLQIPIELLIENQKARISKRI